MKKEQNPFPVSGFRSPEFFCDREHEISALHEHLINDRNALLFGWRRLGKTALIQNFFQLLENTGWITIYADLLMTRSGRDAVKTITQSVIRRTGQTNEGLSNKLMVFLSKLGAKISFDSTTGAPKISFQLQEGFEPQQSLETLGDYLSDLNKPIVIALDEFQRVADYTDVDGEAWFRSWGLQHPNIRFLYSGSQRSILESMFQNKTRPFYQSTQLISLEPIEKTVYVDFIREKFEQTKKQISQHLAENLYDWAEGQTYTIQLICNKLWGSGIEIDEALLTRIQTEILEQESTFFGQIARLVTPNQWKLLKAVAEEGRVSNVFQSDFIKKYDLHPTSSVQVSLRKLIEQEILIKDNGKIRIQDLLFQRWIQSLP